MLLAVRRSHNAGGLGIADDALVMIFPDEIRTDKNSKQLRYRAAVC